MRGFRSSSFLFLNNKIYNVIMAKDPKKSTKRSSKTNNNSANSSNRNTTASKNKGKTTSKTSGKKNVETPVKMMDIPVGKIDVSDIKISGETFKSSPIDYSLANMQRAMWEQSEDAKANGYVKVKFNGDVIATYTDILQDLFVNGNNPTIDFYTLDQMVGAINGADYGYSDYQKDDENKKDPKNNTTEQSQIVPLKDTDEIPNENYTDPILYVRNYGKRSIISVPASSAPPDITKDGKISKNKDNVYEVNKYVNTTSWPFFQMGVIYPLINLNGYLVPENEIAYFDLLFDDILPKVKIALYDKNISTDTRKQILFDSAATTTVIIRPQINGAYNSIHLDFRVSSDDVTEDRYNGNNITIYSGVLKNEKLWDQRPKNIRRSKSMFSSQNTSIVQSKPKDSNTETRVESSIVKAIKNNEYFINTYDMILSIAELTDMGFQATDQCAEIQDNDFRYKEANETYIDFIRRQLMSGGYDENSVFDCWINMNGFFTLVNVSWVLGQVSKITPKMLTIKANIGIPQSDGNEVENKWVKTYRTLTNLNTNTLSNMTFNNIFFSRTDNTSNVENGIIQSVSTCQIEGIKSDEKTTLAINTTDIGFIDNDVDALYQFLNQNNQICAVKDIQMNMSMGNVDIIKQRHIVKGFFELKRSHIFTLTLNTINFGLDRGMLVNILYVVTNISEKIFILKNIKNISGDSSNEKPIIDIPDGLTTEQIIENPNYPLPDMSRSGIYYIDKMYIHFDSISRRLMQSFELIKLGNVSTYQNAYSTMHLSDKENAELEEFKAQEFTNYTAPTEGGDKFDAILDDIIDGWERDENGNIKTDKNGNRIDRYGYNQDKAEKEYKEYTKKVKAAEVQYEKEKKEAEKRAAEEAKKAAAKAEAEAKKAAADAKKQGNGQKDEEKSAETTNKNQKKVTIPVHTVYDHSNQVLYITNDDLAKTTLKPYYDAKGKTWVKLSDGRTVRVMDQKEANLFYYKTKPNTKIDTSTHDYYQKQETKTQQNLEKIIQMTKQRNFSQDVTGLLSGNVKLLRNGKVAYSSIPDNSKPYANLHGYYIDNNGKTYKIDKSK